MIKTFKWIYRLGVLHERRRIKLLIAEYRNNKPEKQDWQNEREFKDSLNLWHSTNYEMTKLVEPEPHQEVVYEPLVARIDDD